MRVLIICLFVVVLGASCSEIELEPYKGTDSYIYFLSQSQMQLGNSMYTYNGTRSVNRNKKRDTLYFRVAVSGLMSSEDRPLKLEQYTIEGETGVPAEPGVNYIAFDDPDIQHLLVVPADSAEVNIPLIFTYDDASAGQYFSRTLNFRLAENEHFKILAEGTNRGLFRGKVNMSQGY